MQRNITIVNEDARQSRCHSGSAAFRGSKCTN